MKLTTAWRLLATVPTVLGICAFVFLTVHLIPGDPVAAILGDQATPEQIRAARAQLNLDDSLGSQFMQFVQGYARGDMGNSLFTRRSVLDEILARTTPTIALAVAGVALSILIGVPLGIVSAVRRGTRTDSLIQTGSTVGIAVPSFWVALLLILVFAIWLPWFPSIGAGGASGDFGDTLRALVLPSFAVALPGIALVTRMTRASVLEVLGEDYIRTARAKGVPERRVLYRHALHNAAIPILTIVSLSFGHLLGGAIVIETIFARPGLGKLLYDSILNRDYPVVQGVCFFVAVGFVLVNLATDLLYGVLDPRERTA